MTTDPRSPGIPGSTVPDARRAVHSGAMPALPALRCTDAARMRDEPLRASAVRYSRFLLLEVPGPWGHSALDGKHIEASVARQLASAAAAADTHVLLIRRPGRHPSTGSGDGKPGTGSRSMSWALADTVPGAERVLWGSWRDPAELLGLDLTAAVPGPSSTAGPQRLALVCTNGKRDQCCAVRGRPVAAAIADAANWDTWECSHLGGHRFAATMMLLPTGDMFGWLDPESALEVMRRFDTGQLMLSRYRGRAGQPEPVQAALHAAAVRLGEFNRGALRASWSRRLPAGEDGPPSAGGDSLPAQDADRWEVRVTHQPERGREAAYRVVLARSELAPAFLSCADDIRRAEAHYETLSFSPIPFRAPARA